MRNEGANATEGFEAPKLHHFKMFQGLDVSMKNF